MPQKSHIFTRFISLWISIICFIFCFFWRAQCFLIECCNLNRWLWLGQVAEKRQMKEELRKAMEEERARVQLCAGKSAKATAYFLGLSQSRPNNQNPKTNCANEAIPTFLSGFILLYGAVLFLCFHKMFTRLFHRIFSDTFWFGKPIEMGIWGCIVPKKITHRNKTQPIFPANWISSNFPHHALFFMCPTGFPCINSSICKSCIPPLMVALFQNFQTILCITSFQGKYGMEHHCWFFPANALLYWLFRYLAGRLTDSMMSWMAD